MARRQYPAWQRRHEGVLVWWIENPSGKLKDCAKATGYSRWQVSRIINSPDFQRRFHDAINVRHQMIDAAYVDRMMSRVKPV